MQQQQDAELRTLLERLGVRSLEEALRLVQDLPTPRHINETDAVRAIHRPTLTS